MRWAHYTRSEVAGDDDERELEADGTSQLAARRRMGNSSRRQARRERGKTAAATSVISCRDVWLKGRTTPHLTSPHITRVAPSLCPVPPQRRHCPPSSPCIASPSICTSVRLPAPPSHVSISRCAVARRLVSARFPPPRSTATPIARNHELTHSPVRVSSSRFCQISSLPPFSSLTMPTSTPRRPDNAAPAPSSSSSSSLPFLELCDAYKLTTESCHHANTAFPQTKRCRGSPNCLHGLKGKKGIWDATPAPLKALGPDPANKRRQPETTLVGLTNLGATCLRARHSSPLPPSLTSATLHRSPTSCPLPVFCQAT